ncbi:MAG: RNA 3'-terminal phosphate cyclase [Candidatus Aenigmatarchaeota archaeon]
MKNIIEVAGDYLEGGGAIVRVSLGLSILTQKPVRIYNIRSNRPKPGLHTQLVKSIEAAKKLCNAKTKGITLRSKEIEFYPQKIKESKLTIEVPTAASIGLILQLLQLACISAKHKINISIKGGASFGKWAPPTPYLENVTIPLLEKIDYKIKLNVKRHGFYPRGGSEVEIEIYPAEKLKQIILTEQGNIKNICGISIASKHLEKSKVAERQKDSAEKIISKKFAISPKIDYKYCDAICPGSGIVLWAKTTNSILGASSLGEIRKKAEDVGKECANLLKKQLDTNACLDRWMTDQILPYLAIASGKISVAEITNHCLTNIWVIEKFLPVKFTVNGKKNESGIIICNKR